MKSGGRRVGVTRRGMLGALGAGCAARATDMTPGAQAQAAKKKRATLETRLTREYGVRYPFVGAGMGFIALPELVAAVSNAGGIGVIGVAPEQSAMLPTPETTGDFEEMCLAAGESAKLIKDVRPAAEVIARMMHEARHALRHGRRVD